MTFRHSLESHRLRCCWGSPRLCALAAGLKDKPPEGVKLAGTEWQLDPYNSDDPGEAIDRASRKVQQRAPSPRTSSGGIFGRDDPTRGRASAPGDPIGGGGFPSDSGSRVAFRP